MNHKKGFPTALALEETGEIVFTSEITLDRSQ